MWTGWLWLGQDCIDLGIYPVDRMALTWNLPCGQVGFDFDRIALAWYLPCANNGIDLVLTLWTGLYWIGNLPCGQSGIDLEFALWTGLHWLGICTVDTLALTWNLPKWQFGFDWNLPCGLDGFGLKFTLLTGLHWLVICWCILVACIAKEIWTHVRLCPGWLGSKLSPGQRLLFYASCTHSGSHNWSPACADPERRGGGDRGSRIPWKTTKI